MIILYGTPLTLQVKIRIWASHSDALLERLFSQMSLIKTTILSKQPFTTVQQTTS